LSIFFAAGACISGISALSLLFPGSLLEPMWRLNPRAHSAFSHIGGWAVILMGVVSLACALTAIGLWAGKLWGYLLAIAMLVINLTGDVYNFASGAEPRAVVGVPIVIVILLSILTKKTQYFFLREKEPHKDRN
jgi:uncharacterized membrane protein (DUF2068 family)